MTEQLEQKRVDFPDMSNELRKMIDRNNQPKCRLLGDGKDVDIFHGDWLINFKTPDMHTPYIRTRLLDGHWEFRNMRLHLPFDWKMVRKSHKKLERSMKK